METSKLTEYLTETQTEIHLERMKKYPKRFFTSGKLSVKRFFLKRKLRFCYYVLISCKLRSN